MMRNSPCLVTFGSLNSLGGFMYKDNLSTEFREAVQPEVKFRQFADIQSAYGKSRGENFHWNVYLNIQTQGGTLVETNTMPESNFRVIQGTLTVNEYGNSIPYTGKLESLAKESVKKPVMRALKNDAKKAFDFAAHTQFNNTLLRVVPAAAGTSTATLTLTTNGTATATNNIVYQKEHAKLVYDLMRERNIPAYMADDYYAIAWPATLRRLKNDLESIHQYTSEGFGMIMNGEIGVTRRPATWSRPTSPRATTRKAVVRQPRLDVRQRLDLLLWRRHRDGRCRRCRGNPGEDAGRLRSVQGSGLVLSRRVWDCTCQHFLPGSGPHRQVGYRVLINIGL